MKITSKIAKMAWDEASRFWGARYCSCKTILGRILKVVERNRLGRLIGRAARKLVDGRYFFCRVGDRIRIITPEPIGAKGLDYYDQVGAAAHEFEHHIQSAEAGGATRFYAEYTGRPGVRAVWEADACLAYADVMYFLGRRIPRAKDIFTLQWGVMYGLGSEHVKLAANRYNRGLRGFENGKFATKSGATMVAILRNIAERGA
jgi:hypothetical protein